jgi:DNA repair exonuclease SbcCD ATPase subunit
MDEEIRRQLSSLKSDIDKQQLLFDRIEQATLKLSELTTNATTLIAVLETKNDHLEKLVMELSQHVEKRRSEREIYEKEVHDKLNLLRLELNNESEQYKMYIDNKIKVAIDTLKLSITNDLTKIKDENETLKKYLYYASGGIAVALFIFNLFKGNLMKVFGLQ